MSALPIDSSVVYIIQNSLHDAPMLSSSTLSYDAILEFKCASKCFFNAKNIAPASQVSQILYNFNDSCILTWIETMPELITLVTLFFSDFITQLKKTWLSLDWEDDIVFRIINFQGPRKFNAWVADVHLANSLLPDHPLQVLEASFCTHIIARMSAELCSEYQQSNHEQSITCITDFNTWLYLVHFLDDRVCSQSCEWLAAITQVHTALANITQQLNAVSASLAAHIGPAPGSLNHPLPPPVTANSFFSACLPPSGAARPDEASLPFSGLTLKQKNLLSAHRGCFKCCKFYADHIFSSYLWWCTTASAVLNCATLGAALALAARSSKTASPSNNTMNMPASTATSPIIIAAFLNDDSDDDLHTDIGFPALNMSDGFEPYEYVPLPVLPVPLPSIPPSPSLPSHFWWNCHLDAPLTCAPTPVKALIDSGSPPVLISEECVELYGLVPRHLHKPLSVTGVYSAIGNIVLDAYIKLHLSSIDCLWSSYVVPAIIIPSLHTDIILGLDFLACNCIVIDPEDCTAVCKTDSYDLLNPLNPANFHIIPSLSLPLCQKLEQ